jgi:hypothetical protein
MWQPDSRSRHSAHAQPVKSLYAGRPPCEVMVAMASSGFAGAAENSIASARIGLAWNHTREPRNGYELAALRSSAHCLP